VLEIRMTNAPSSRTVRRSAPRFDKFVDLLRRRENNRGSVAHHAGRRNRGSTLLRSILTGVGFEAQIALPKGAGLAVGRGNSIGVAAIGDSFDLNSRFELFKIRILAATHHAPHSSHSFHASLFRRLLRYGSRFGGLFEKGQQVC